MPFSGNRKHNIGIALENQKELIQNRKLVIYPIIVSIVTAVLISRCLSTCLTINQKNRCLFHKIIEKRATFERIFTQLKGKFLKLAMSTEKWCIYKRICYCLIRNVRNIIRLASIVFHLPGKILGLFWKHFELLYFSFSLVLNRTFSKITLASTKIGKRLTDQSDFIFG